MVDEPIRADADERGDWANRETLLDVVVNLIPMGILLFFIVYYTLFRPWEWEPGMFVLMHFLTVFPFVMLAVLTYISARAIAGAETGAEEGT